MSSAELRNYVLMLSTAVARLRDEVLDTDPTLEFVPDKVGAVLACIDPASQMPFALPSFQTAPSGLRIWKRGEDCSEEEFRDYVETQEKRLRDEAASIQAISAHMLLQHGKAPHIPQHVSEVMRRLDEPGE
jgi:hypothetical protein